MLHFSQLVWPLSCSVWDVFNNFLLIDAIDRSKISSDQKRFFIALSLYPLSFFANTPFKANIQRDCKHNFKWLEAKTAMSIYNGTLDIFIWLKWRRLCRFTDLKTVSFEKFICFTYAEKPLIHIWSEVSFQGYHCKLGNAIFAWRDTKDYDYSPIKIENQGPNSRMEQEGCLSNHNPLNVCV